MVQISEAVSQAHKPRRVARSTVGCSSKPSFVFVQNVSGQRKHRRVMLSHVIGSDRAFDSRAWGRIFWEVLLCCRETGAVLRLARSELKFKARASELTPKCGWGPKRVVPLVNGRACGQGSIRLNQEMKLFQAGPLVETLSGPCVFHPGRGLLLSILCNYMCLRRPRSSHSRWLPEAGLSPSVGATAAARLVSERAPTATRSPEERRVKPTFPFKITGWSCLSDVLVSAPSQHLLANRAASIRSLNRLLALLHSSIHVTRFRLTQVFYSILIPTTYL